MTEKTRMCSRSFCQREAVHTLTYAYADSTAVVGPLSTVVEPHGYDLCAFHADRLTAPRGWEVVRLDGEPGSADPFSAQSPSGERSAEQPSTDERFGSVPDGTERPRLRAVAPVMDEAENDLPEDDPARHRLS